MKYKHITYNPQLFSIAKVIFDLKDDSWALSYIVPITMYEHVAVFEKIE